MVTMADVVKAVPLAVGLRVGSLGPLHGISAFRPLEGRRLRALRFDGVRIWLEARLASGNDLLARRALTRQSTDH